MALSLVYPLKKGTYHRVRGFAAHVRDNPGTWYGIDEGCVVGTPLYACDDGKVSHTQKISYGGGWNFRLNLTKYPGWFIWYAHCSSIPSNGKVYKDSQVIGKSGNTGKVSGPHLHYSLMQGSTPRDPDNKSIVKWREVAMYLTKAQKRKICLDFLGRECSAASYAANLTYEGLIKRGYPEIASNYKKLNTYYKKSRDLEAKVAKMEKDFDAALAKTAGDYQTAIENLSKEVYETRQDYHMARDEAVERTEELQMCEEKLKKALGGSQGPTEPKKDKDLWSWQIIWKFIKDLFRKGV